MEEEDFVSAEIEVVPAGKSRDFGLDRSMVIGYGHDDRVCAYAEIEAMFQITDTPKYTCCCILADKEEIGSVGATGMQARYFENAMAEIMDKLGAYSELRLRRALQNSRMLSCDVSAGFDPSYAGMFEKKNAAFLGKGVCFNKYTGARGKSGSNDANAEYLGKLRAIMEEGKVVYQTAELGKVDQGGGGTIAYICALYGMNVIDSGVAVLSMHAPWELGDHFQGGSVRGRESLSRLPAERIIYAAKPRIFRGSFFRLILFRFAGTLLQKGPDKSWTKRRQSKN